MERRRLSKGHSRMGRPSIRSWPSGASQRRATNAARVVLPLPVGPTMANVEPAGTFRFMSLRTGWAAPLFLEEEGEELAGMPFASRGKPALPVLLGLAPLPARFVGYVKVRLRNSISPAMGVCGGILAARSSICGVARRM